MLHVSVALSSNFETWQNLEGTVSICIDVPPLHILGIHSLVIAVMPMGDTKSSCYRIITARIAVLCRPCCVPLVTCGRHKEWTRRLSGGVVRYMSQLKRPPFHWDIHSPSAWLLSWAQASLPSNIPISSAVLQVSRTRTSKEITYITPSVAIACICALRRPVQCGIIASCVVVIPMKN